MTSEILDKLENVESQDEEWADLFEELLDDYDYENPERGQIISGEIIQVDEDSILVDIGAKRDAIVPRKDLDRLDDEMIAGLSQGDKIPVYVMRTAKIGGDLLVSINRGLEQEDWEHAEEMLEEGEALPLEIIGQNKGGVVVRFGRLRGFVPNSHIPDLRRDGGFDHLREQKEEMIGDELVVKVIEVNQKRRRLVLSSRAARQERRLLRLKELAEGTTITGTVVNLVDFGAFVDIGGVDGLIHISELDWSRVDHPSEVLELGQEVEIEITNVDVDRERVSLSRKNLLANPWDSIEQKYSPGELVEGEITNVRNFGAFVMLPEGVEGLIHVSEIGIIGPGSPQDVVHPGDNVLARVIDIEPDRERISLSLSRVSKDEQLAWLEQQKESDVEPIDEEEEEEVLPVTDFDAELEAELGERLPEDIKAVGEETAADGEAPEAATDQAEAAEAEAAAPSPEGVAEAVDEDDAEAEAVEDSATAEAVDEDDAEAEAIEDSATAEAVDEDDAEAEAVEDSATAETVNEDDAEAEAVEDSATAEAELEEDDADEQPVDQAEGEPEAAVAEKSEA
ncbi:MAG: S1 RNA-binding domain-containing protein [Anaerolineales bacterium]